MSLKETARRAAVRIAPVAAVMVAAFASIASSSNETSTASNGGKTLTGDKPETMSNGSSVTLPIHVTASKLPHLAVTLNEGINTSSFSSGAAVDGLSVTMTTDDGYALQTTTDYAVTTLTVGDTDEAKKLCTTCADGTPEDCATCDFHVNMVLHSTHSQPIDVVWQIEAANQDTTDTITLKQGQ